jgi:hypothetical protein
MPLRLLHLAAVLLGAAAPVPDAVPPRAAVRGPPPGLAASQPEAPPPEAPGSSAAETGVAIAEERADGRSWFAFPMLFWLPETKLGFAGTAGIHFHLSAPAPASSAFLVVGYTIEGQGSVDLSTDVALEGGTLLSGRFRAVHFPDAFYGIGPSTTVDQREEMTRRFLELNLVAELPVLHGRLRAGPRLHAKAEEIRDATPGGLIATGEVTGANGFSAIGLGLSVTWDSRDRPLWPSRGAFAQASYVWYPSSLGRNDGFARGYAEGRLFLPLGRERVLGLAAILEESEGATPFSMLSKLGSTRYLRGIPEGRYRDRLGWAAQAEVRLPIAERIAAALFGAFGSVAPDLSGFDASTLKIAGGAGLRFRLTDQGANLRFDVAASEGGPEVYVLLLEAF